jgi:hypothetical protein
MIKADILLLKAQKKSLLRNKEWHLILYIHLKIKRQIILGLHKLGQLEKE